MQGHRPTVYLQTPTQTATSGTTQNVNRDWTCKRWFNNIADKVAAKTHQYFGKFVAVATLPFTFIPSLACDLFYGAKSLYQRTVSKAPVQSQVSTRSTPASRPEATQKELVQNLERDLEYQQFINSNLQTDFEEILNENTNLRKRLEEQTAIKLNQFHKINDLEHRLEILTSENNGLRAELGRFENVVRPADLVRTTDD